MRKHTWESRGSGMDRYIPGLLKKLPRIAAKGKKRKNFYWKKFFVLFLPLFLDCPSGLPDFSPCFSLA